MKRLLLSALSALVIAGLLAASAEAATLKLACAGKGARNRDSSGEVLCAGGLKGRTISGTIRNDAGQPVAGKVTVTFVKWAPSSGGGFSLKPTGTKDLTAKANGAFSITVNPPTRQSLHFDLQADPVLGIAGGLRADAEVSRQFKVTVSKLGGGVVRLNVKGLSVRPVKAYVLDSTGNYIPGVPRGKNLNSKGQATFNVGSRRGTLTYYVDVGRLDDLFWDHRATKFRL
jgi:hypothetical protein